MADEQLDTQEDLDLQAAIAMSLVRSNHQQAACFRLDNYHKMPTSGSERSVMYLCGSQTSSRNRQHAVQGQDVSGGKRGAEDELEDAGGGPPDDTGLTSCEVRMNVHIPTNWPTLSRDTVRQLKG